jgi:branched-chain amino acid transport system permease protein
MISWPNFIAQLFNGLALGALLALISSGLTIVYGTLGVLNLGTPAMSPTLTPARSLLR